MRSIGKILKELRKKNKLLIREVSAAIKIDPALLSKYEKGYRLPTKEQILKFEKYYHILDNKLIIEWLSDRIVYDVGNEENAIDALIVAEDKIKNLKAK